MKLVLATANPHKAAELIGLLTGVEVLPRPVGLAEVAETGTTLEANARLKARAVCAAAGWAAVADDTGLEVDALGGAPGVYSARFAGPEATYADNVAALLGALEEAGARGPAERRARFVTVALAVFPDGGEVVCSGRVEGVIVDEPRGKGGFGYDTVFAPDGGGGLTFAQMSPSAKATISHRGRAFRQLVVELAALDPAVSADAAS
ncbi:MAG: RdgB/HAM1 family non-canonical purine NTP pyrophosphatase [Acidimicrobiales bacterium]